MTGEGDRAPHGARLIEAVDELARSTETDFLAAGSSLAAAIERFETLEDAARGIAGLSEWIGRVARGARGLDTGLRKAVQEVETALVLLPDLTRICRNLGGCLGVMLRSVRTMRVVSINARVVVATMETRDSELGGFADDVQKVSDEIENVLAGVSAVLAALEASADRFAIDGDGLKALASRRMMAALDCLATEFERCERGMGELTNSGGILARTGEAIRRDVTAAVFALQAGDALRQRLEHCSEILATSLSGEDGSEALLNLARRQLEDLHARHQEGVGQAARALSGTAAQANGFRSEIGKLVPSPEGPGRQMHAAVSDIGILLGECTARQDALHQGALDMAERMGEMRSAMSLFGALAERIRFIALNAVIACEGYGAQAGPLKAISQQLRELASICTVSRGQMETLFTGLSGSWSGMRDQLGMARSTMREVLDGPADEIKTYLSDLDNVLDELGQRIEAGRSGLDENVAAGTAALASHVEALDRLILLARRLTPEKPGATGAGESLRAASAVLRSSLTIEQERQVHDAWHRAIFGSGPAVAASVAAPASLDEILFA